MPLCKLCTSIPLENLPPFPQENFRRTLSGYPRFHHMVLKRDLHKKDTPLKQFGVQYHADLDSLCKAASGGCELCQAVEKEANALIEEIATLPQPRLGVMQCEPSWDMWLTRRSESEGTRSGDGLWVVTRSSWESDNWLVPVASIVFASDEDDPRSSGSRDRVLREVPDQTTLNHVTNWLKKCNEHPHCHSRDKSSLPTRLLDVGTADSASSTIKLVEPDSDLCDRYITLSYCWGQGAKHFTTTSETLHAHKEGISLEALPQTLRDAVIMTRTLGVRYLWIDSLCICQDDLKDWERESAQMAAVYANSYLTLAATKSSDVNGGLLSARKPRSYFQLSRGGSGTDDGYILAAVVPLDKEIIPEYHMKMKDEPLSKRAWGLQERALARRILHFGSEQLYWECLEGFESEEGVKLPYRLPCINPDEDVIAHVDKVTQRNAELHKGLDRSGSSLRSWPQILWEYGPRELTDPADKLPAISGVAKTFSKILDDEYLAGLWRKSLIEGLCWQPLSCKVAPGGYRAPSWSWAAVDGVPATGFLAEGEPQAQVLDAKVEIDGDNPFGRVKDGWIKLEAPLIKMVLSENKGPVGHLLLRSNGWADDVHEMLDTMDGRSEEAETFFKSKDVYAVVLAFVYGHPLEPDPERKHGTAHALLVTPDHDRPGCMKRIGMMLRDAKNFGTEELASSRSTITLV
ncbi:Putative heterokaryon incompatibility [Colletotrichum destructivum]|uniref:Heterokaryon incompatibility n=1 Tax=Colletotrichum destructivum TaxID=34406 RepID=A0AAX4IDB9_9PEZI|nr:Putative heterokaryon incompatibility [Colletotrichum destructivum]